MNVEKLIKLEAIREMFSIGANGEMPEGSRLLLSAMEEARFEPEEALVRFGTPGDEGMYILVEGSAQVLDQEGRQINTPLGPGSIVGEMALIRDELREATVRAETVVVCAHLSKVQFEEAARYNKKLYGALLSLAYKKTAGLVREQARLHSELEIAARIQTGLLRKNFEDIEQNFRLRVAASMNPAKEVGGDFYDIFPVSRQKACIVMADVSGKGVPAAMFMAMAKTHIKSYGKLDMPLAELVYRLNNQLCEDNPEEMFVTAFIGMLDITTGLLTYVNAGHNRPFLSAGNNPFIKVASKADLVLGLWENISYREQTIILKRPWCFYLYTDGVTEAENREGELFGDRRLGEALNCCRQKTEPVNLTSEILRHLTDFSKGAGQTDDITMLYLTAAGDDSRNEKEPETLSLSVPAKMEYMEPLLDKVRKYLAARKCPAEVMMKLEIALEELFTNIADYAYHQDGGEIGLDCSMEKGSGFLKLQVKDHGISFNPLEKKEPDFFIPFEERPVGGLGIYMVKQFVDEIEYEYKDGCNLLTLKKNIHYNMPQ